MTINAPIRAANTHVMTHANTMIVAVMDPNMILNVREVVTSFTNESMKFDLFVMRGVDGI